MKNEGLIAVLLLILILLAGCSPKSYPTSPFPETETLQPQIELALPTETKTPVITTLPSTTLATLAVEAREAYLLLEEFLENESPCQLPCWGGVTPGVSTASEAEQEFMKLSSISSPDFSYFGQSGDSWYLGTLFILYPLQNTQIQIDPGFLASLDNKIVINIGFIARSLPQNSKGLYFGDQEYNGLLFAYTMPQIFTTYGLPNLIYTRADINAAEPTAPDFFIIRLLYLDLGIFISYKMPMEQNGSAFTFCPSESLIDVELTPPDLGENYEDFFQQLGALEWTTLDKTNHQFLKDALNMTNEEFSQIIISAPETCFETPIDIWPEP